MMLGAMQHIRKEVSVIEVGELMIVGAEDCIDFYQDCRLRQFWEMKISVICAIQTFLWHFHSNNHK